MKEFDLKYRTIETVTDRVASPAGRAIGNLLGQIQYRGECSDWLSPLAELSRAVTTGIGDGYIRLLEAPEQASRSV